MLFLLRHPNIVNLFGTSKTGQKLIIVTEFLENGSLFELLHKRYIFFI
jgi:serine/threonine protein kinase